MDNEELRQIMNGWSAAMVANEAAEIGSYMADNWVIVSPGGITTKSQFINVVESGELTHDTFDFELDLVQNYPDTAIMAGRVKNTGIFKGQPFTSNEWASDVFVKTGGKWLCVLSHIAPVAKADTADQCLEGEK